MGLCISKKNKDSPPDESKAEKKSPQRVAAEEATEKKICETPVKKTAPGIAAEGAGGVPVVHSVEVLTPCAVFRSSSCTREEVDAILIQCGRLSRSSSANASAEAGAGRRKYSGSKRSYDFDSERKGDEEEGEWAEKSVLRPSPRRRTPSRERSGSRDGGGRRVSRSPGRRPELSASTGSCSDRSRQPVKMVAVPPRDKGRGASPAASGKKGGETTFVRSASRRSRSPANTQMSDENATNHPQLQSLSQSSLRNPMGEIDENTARAIQNASKDKKVEKIKEREESKSKPSQTRSQKSSENSVQIGKSLEINGAAAEFKGNNAIEKTSTKVSEALNLEVESCQTISGTRSSGDLDQIPGVNQETVHSASLYLAACISKACDLNSTSSENKNHVEEQPNHDDNLFGELSNSALPFVEPEISVDDDLWQPNFHKYVTVRELRADVEPQESAGSNSFAGTPWASPSGWEPISGDSSECRRSSRPNDGEEAEQEDKPSSLSHQSQQPVSEVIRELETRDRRSRGHSSLSSNNSGHSATSSENKREPYRRAQLRRADSSANGGGSGSKAGRSRGSPIPTAAAS